MITVVNYYTLSTLTRPKGRTIRGPPFEYDSEIMLWNTIRLIEPNLRFYLAIILARYDYFQIKSLVFTSNLLPMKFLIHDIELDKRYYIIQVIGNIVQIHKWRLYPFILRLSLIFYDEPRFAYEFITNITKHLLERICLT